LSRHDAGTDPAVPPRTILRSEMRSPMVPSQERRRVGSATKMRCGRSIGVERPARHNPRGLVTHWSSQEGETCQLAVRRYLTSSLEGLDVGHSVHARRVLVPSTAANRAGFLPRDSGTFSLGAGAFL
jgi:hypothetical protein